jgi:murein endopeptidase
VLRLAQRAALPAAVAAAAGLAAGCEALDVLRPQPQPPPGPPAIEWRRSTSLGAPSDGRLADGVRLPAEGRHFATWDHGLKRSPSRPWRRWGADGTVRTVLRIAREHRRANPGAPRVLVGDISRPRGGDFGARFGGRGHVSHQSGVDVDVYYPRRDRVEAEPRRVAQVDGRLAQDLVDRFVAAGAIRVFVGPRSGLTGPPGTVQPLARHDNHLHARFADARPSP